MTLSRDMFTTDPALDSREITFENPTGARGAGGQAAGGRKGAPSRHIAPGERVILADIAGPGIVRHPWMAITPAPPQILRAQGLEVFYDHEKFPTICGTGLEDYAGTAWGMGQHDALYAGVPLDVRQPADVDDVESEVGGDTKFASFYRWHMLDPMMYANSLKVTIQQIGAALFETANTEERKAYEADHPVAGTGWQNLGPVTLGIVERVDD